MPKDNMFIIPCKCGRSSLAMQSQAGLFITLCSCGRAKRNSVLAYIREQGVDVASSLFTKKKGDQCKTLICGKFKDLEALDKAYQHLCEKAGVSPQEAEKRAKQMGKDQAYLLLQRNLSRAVSR